MKKWVTIYVGFVVAVASAAYAADPKPEPVPPTSLDLRTTVDGTPIDLADSLPTGRDTAGVLKFLQTGIDPYIDDDSCLRLGQSLFLSDCSGCHGEVGDGKIGPGLNDEYWTYPKTEHDQGIFETIFAGARAMMGPHNQDLTLDQMLQVIAWVRHLYKDPVSHAFWLNDEQKKHYKPYTQAEGKRLAALHASTPGQCQGAALREEKQQQEDMQSQ
ncbi:MAG: cytochrome c(L), periplasmic [Methylovirgula sp.]